MLGTLGMAAPCPELHPTCVPVSWQAQLPAPARVGLWSYPGISPAVPVHLLQPAPEISRMHLSHCFCHESGQNISSPPANILENHLWSMPLLQIPFLSPWYRKGRPERWLQSWRGCLLCLQAACITFRTWQVKPLRSACTGTAQGLQKRWLLHCHHTQPFTSSSWAEKSLGTAHLCRPPLVWFWFWSGEEGLGKRPKIATKHGILSEWAWGKIVHNRENLTFRSFKTSERIAYSKTWFYVTVVHYAWAESTFLFILLCTDIQHV